MIKHRLTFLFSPAGFKVVCLSSVVEHSGTGIFQRWMYPSHRQDLVSVSGRLSQKLNLSH